MPLVLMVIWEDKMNDPGEISSQREPTAENMRVAQTPRDLKADILVWERTVEGESAWSGLWRAMSVDECYKGTREGMQLLWEGKEICMAR